MATTAALFGSTGLVGQHILETLLSADSISAVQTIGRRPPKVPEQPKLHAIVEADTARWGERLAALSPAPAAVFSAVGTTRAAAGGIQNQWKIDHDANVEIARAAKAAGAKTFVFVSSAGVRSFLGSSVPYGKMKIGVEDAIGELGFEQTIILRPGMLLGEREKGKEKVPLLEGLVSSLGRLSQGLLDGVGQQGEVVGRAAVHAAQIAAEGKAPSKDWVLEQADIVRLGRTEWKE